jgi:2,4-diaminopentanoate dehydrogenase
MLRVVQWATGNIGMKALRAVIGHPDLELVGLFVFSDEKAGQDAGTLCGLAPTGVVATRDVDEIIGLGADCIVYMPLLPDIEVLCRLLASGSNVVTSCTDFHWPALLEPAEREAIEAACAEGNTSIHSTGSSPGFISEALPFVLTSISRRLDRIELNEFADVSSRKSPEMLFRLMGFGRAVDDFDGRRWGRFGPVFTPTLYAFADAVGLPLDSVDLRGEVAGASERVEIAAGTIAAGHVAGERLTVSGMRDGEPLVQFRATWYCSTLLDADWDLQETGWRVKVAGDTPLDVRIAFPVQPEDYADFSPGLTAHRPINAVKAVCAAAPGIRVTSELPQIIATYGPRQGQASGAQ